MQTMYIAPYTARVVKLHSLRATKARIGAAVSCKTEDLIWGLAFGRYRAPP